MRRVHKLLEEKNYQVRMVSAGNGESFGDLTVKYLNELKEKKGVMIAVCTRRYGEATSSPYSSHFELKYAMEYRIKVLPLRVENTYPPEPPCGPGHPYDEKGDAKNFINAVFLPSIVPQGYLENIFNLCCL